MSSNDANRRRTLLEIVAEILGACRPSARKTTVMYRCNMSFNQLTGYLDMVLRAQLLHVENNGLHLLFSISGKGKDFLRAYENLMGLMEKS